MATAMPWKTTRKMNAGPYNAPELECGFLSLPIIHKGKVILQSDFLGDCFIASYDVETGKEIWRLSGGGDIPLNRRTKIGECCRDEVVILSFHETPSTR